MEAQFRQLADSLIFVFEETSQFRDLSFDLLEFEKLGVNGNNIEHSIQTFTMSFKIKCVSTISIYLLTFVLGS